MGGVCAAALLVIALIIWQDVTAHDAPGPTLPNTSPAAAFLDIGILVFREGIE
jgi:high-affinity iron transporter